MKNILIHVKNRLLLASMVMALKQTNDFKVEVGEDENPDDLITKLETKKYDIFLMDIARMYPYNYQGREAIIHQIKKLKLTTKIVVYCDSNSEQEMAYKVRDLKVSNLIDAFFYESVDDKYMVAILDSL